MKGVNAMFKLFASPRITVFKISKGSVLYGFMPMDTFIWLGGHMGYIWIVIALAFLFAELGTPGLFFFVSFAIGSLCASILAFCGYVLVLQCVFGLIVSVASFFVIRKYLKKSKLSEVHYEKPETNIDALVGQEGVVVSVIKPNSKGRVKIGGEEWVAEVDGDFVLSRGAVVFVLRVEGNKVIVRGL